MEYYSAIEKNTFESVLMRWMKLELIIESEHGVAVVVWSNLDSLDGDQGTIFAGR